MEKLTINGDWYISLDDILDVDSCPPIEHAIVNSYDYIKHNCSIRTFDLNGQQIFDTWYNAYHNGGEYKTNADIFKEEYLHGVRSPYHVLALCQGGHKGYIYDSLETDKTVWDSITWRPQLKDIWAPHINWIENLPLDSIGHCSFFINRPGVVPHYHVDSGNDNNLENWKPKPHREEFIWINFNADKTFYILDDWKPIPIMSRSAFFNTNNYHGSHEYTHSWSVSLRIECVFSQTLRQRMNIDHIHQYYYERS